MQDQKLPSETTPLYEHPTDIAFDRDRFAADRTIMAWIRTSLSMIGFGFSIFKFFEFLKDLTILEGIDVSAHESKALGFTLVSLGVFFLLLAMLEYIFFIKRLCEKVHKKFYFSAALLASIILSIIGIAVLMSMLYKEIGI